MNLSQSSDNLYMRLLNDGIVILNDNAVYMPDGPGTIEFVRRFLTGMDLAVRHGNLPSSMVAKLLIDMKEHIFLEDALILRDIIKSLQMDVETFNYGWCFGFSALVLSGGKLGGRYALPNSLAMIRFASEEELRNNYEKRKQMKGQDTAVSSSASLRKGSMSLSENDPYYNEAINGEIDDNNSNAIEQEVKRILELQRKATEMLKEDCSRPESVDELLERLRKEGLKLQGARAAIEFGLVDKAITDSSVLMQNTPPQQDSLRQSLNSFSEEGGGGAP